MSMRRRRFIQSLVGGAAASGVVGTAAGQSFGGANDTLDEIEILTDEYGKSHVYADSLYALGYGNGYVQARDRLFEMDALRHVGYGDSAAIIGPSQLSSDISVRRDLYSEEEIQSMWDDASETTREMVEGFCDGVNRRMVELASKGNLPGEFAALGHAPEPWKPEDSVAAISYAIGFFGVSGGSELSNAKTFAEMLTRFDDPEDAFAAYEDRNTLRTPEEHYTTIPESDGTVEYGETVPESWTDLPAEQRRFVEAAPGAEPWGIETDVTIPPDIANGIPKAQGLFEGFKFGSNALVVDGDHTATGNPMLVGGPQMSYFKPPVIHEVGLHGAGFDVSGVGVVGAPSIVVGRTPNLAWTVTSGRDDMVDVVAVDLDPDDKHRYQWGEGWHTMSTQTVRHATSPIGGVVEGANEVRYVEQEIAHIEQDGEVMPVVAWNPEENVAYCKRKTSRYDELSGAFQWAELGRVDNVEEFEQQLGDFPFTFNFHVISDNASDPDIAYIHTGKVPDRNTDFDGRFPIPGGETHWYGTREGLGLETKARGSSRGYFANWNNGPAVGWRADDAEQSWGSTHRVEVLDRFTRRKLDETGDAITYEDAQWIIEEAAKHDSAAHYSVPYFIEAGRDSDDQLLRRMADELETWLDDDCSWKSEDGRYVTGGMAIFEAVRKELQERVFRDELGDSVESLAYNPSGGGGGINGGPDPHAADHGNASQDQTFVDALRGATNHDWFASVDSDTKPGEGNRRKRRDETIRAAMQSAGDSLVAEYDSRYPSEWRLEEYVSTFTALGATPTETIPMSNRASYMQAIEIGGGLARSGDVLPPGNSGQVNLAELVAALAGSGPDRLTDQLALYREYGYKPHPITREDIEQVATEQRTVQTTTPDLDGPVRGVRELSRDAASLVTGRPGDLPEDLGTLLGTTGDTLADAPNGILEGLSSGVDGM
jgi:penicillin amidase